MNASFQTCVDVRVGDHGAVSRRGFLRTLAGAGTVLAGMRWRDRLGAYADEIRKQGKACIFLWMSGGPSQFETLDPKPGADTQGPTKAIATSVDGIQIAEHMPNFARLLKELAVIRSMTSKEGNHGRATYLFHTCYPPSGGIVHPGFGANVAKELGREDFDLPRVVSISGPGGGSSFLGVKYAPFVITDPTRPPDNLATPVPPDRLERRLELMKKLEASQERTGAAELVRDHQSLYKEAARMMLSPRNSAFDLQREPEREHEAYGKSAYGKGCLLARRLIEAGVPFVEVQASGWDTHAKELNTLKNLIPPIDQATAALVHDLKDRGLLERTLVIWMGEFGRTPLMNPQAGRDHYPKAFSAALAGAGIKGGQVIGATDPKGIEVVDHPVSVSDLFCTFCKALGIDPRHENASNVGRNIKIVEEGKPVEELF